MRKTGFNIAGKIHGLLEMAKVEAAHFTQRQRERKRIVSAGRQTVGFAVLNGTIDTSRRLKPVKHA
jgi:hypothetical protein